MDWGLVVGLPSVWAYFHAHWFSIVVLPKTNETETYCRKGYKDRRKWCI